MRKLYSPITALLAVASTIAAASFALTAVSYTRITQVAEKAETNEFIVLVSAQKLSVDLLNAQRGFRGYLISNDAQYLDAYDAAIAAAQVDLRKLRDATRERPQDIEDVRQLTRAARAALQIFGKGVELSRLGRHHDAIDLVESGVSKSPLDQAETLLASIQNRALAERTKREALARESARSAARATVLLAALAILLVTLALVVGWAALRVKQRESRTARRDHERLQELFSQAPVFIAIGSFPDLRFEYVNEAYERLVGRSDLVGKTVSEALPEVVSQGFIELLQLAGSGEAVLRRAAPLTLCPEGSDHEVEAYVDFSFQPVRDGFGKVIRIFCVGYDVTREHSIRAQATQLAQELEDARQATALSSLASTIAHELNQPLGAASNYLATAQALSAETSLRRTRVAEVVDRANEQVLRAGEIIRGIMALAGRRPLRRQDVMLKEAIGSALKTAKVSGNLIPSVRCQFPKEPLVVKADRAQLEEVILNLVRNASQALGEDPAGRVTIAVARSNDCAVIKVSDNGPGFAPAVIRSSLKIGTSTTGGLGLGLAIARTIVEAHDGKLKIDNLPDRGAQVRIELPLAN
ncbi:MAG TPA: ATP-binding protein [Sphingomicrobium sp.]